MDMDMMDLDMDMDVDAGGDFPWQDYEDIPEDVLQQMMAQYQDYYGNGMSEGAYDTSPPAPAEFSYAEHFGNCVIPTLVQGFQIVTPLVLGCSTLRIVPLAGLPAVVFHLLSMTAGLLVLSLFFEELITQVVGLGLLGYFLLLVLQSSSAQHKGAITATVFVLVLVFWEVLIADPVHWNTVRGAQMVLVMKVISLAFDLEQGVVADVPDFLEYMGYTFNIATVIFGPWISYTAYMRLLQAKDISVRWSMTTFFKYFQSFVCLLISTCLAPILFLGFNFKWLDAYKDALSFRFSHYFVSFVSESTSLASGLGAPQEGGSKHWELNVARPWHIELPRSLVQVVTNWNLPMHMWLKTYVFKTSRKLGTFVAVLLTYVASSLLHIQGQTFISWQDQRGPAAVELPVVDFTKPIGLNFQLAAVLLSLGFYSYIEHVFRQKLAATFDACILARRCKAECQHKYQSNNPSVMLANLLFGLLAIFHLAYLGVMFNSESDVQERGYGMHHTLRKWSNLSYASHYVAAATFIFYWLIK